MKKILLNTLKVLAFLALLCGVIWCTYKVLRWKDTSGDYFHTMDQLYNTEDDIIDVVFVGSSHCYCGVYPEVIWEQTGIASFDLAISGMDRTSAYYNLKELYKTQTPKVVYVDMYPLFFDRHGDVANEYRNLLAANPSQNWVEHVNSYVEEEDRQSYLFRFPILHTRYRELTRYDFEEYSYNTYGRGRYYSAYTGRGVMTPAEEIIETVGELQEEKREWLNNLRELTDSHGSELVLMMIPYGCTENEQMLLNAVGAYAQENGLRFLNFNRMQAQLGLDSEHDFADESHLNYFGARKVSDYLATDLESNYRLSDHRGEEQYYQWDLSLRDLKNRYNTDLLRGLSLEMTAELLPSCEDAVTIISLEGDIASREDFYGPLATLGMTHDDFLSGGKWIYENGTLTKVAENDPKGEEVLIPLGKYDTARIAYEGEFATGNVMIGSEGYGIPAVLITVTYDRFLQGNICYRIF